MNPTRLFPATALLATLACLPAATAADQPAPPDLPAPPYAQAGTSANSTPPGTTTPAATGADVTSRRAAPDATAAGPGPSAAAAAGGSTDGHNSSGGSITGTEPVPAIGSEIGSPVTVDSATTLEEIRRTTVAGREELAARLGGNVDASARSLALLRARLQANGATPSAEFERALAEVATRERILRSSLQTAARATDDSSWLAAQSALVRDYQSYVEAVAHVEAAAQGSISRAGAPRP